MNTKFELIAEKSITAFGKTLFRIRALVSFGIVSVGDEGGYIEKEENLSADSNAWVSGDAQVYGNAQVSGNAQVYGNAWVSGDAQVSGNAQVYGNAWVSGDARVYGNAQVYGNARVSGDAQVSGNAQVYGNAWVSGDARVYGNAHILWISKIGGELGTLTAFRNKDGGITVTRGCFIGTLDAFRAAVSEKHSGTPHEMGYQKLADYIEFHFTELHPIEGGAA